MFGCIPVDIFIHYIFPHMDAYDLIMWKRTSHAAKRAVEASHLSKEKMYFRIIVCETGEEIRQILKGMTKIPEHNLCSEENAIRKRIFQQEGIDLISQKGSFFHYGDGPYSTYHEPYLFYRTDGYFFTSIEHALQLERRFPYMYSVYCFKFPRGKNICLFDETHETGGCCEGHMHRGCVCVLRIHLPGKMMMYDALPNYESVFKKQKQFITESKEDPLKILHDWLSQKE